MTESHPAGRRIRRLRRISAALLWVLACLGLWFAWEARTEQSEKRPANAASELPASPFERVSNDSNSGIDDEQKAENVSESPTSSTQKMVWDREGIEDFELTDRSGRKVTKADLLGHPWVVCFVFTRCAGPCPKVTGQMRLLQDRLKATDVRLVTLTVDPKFDTPAVLRRYADTFGADPHRWLFLTGDQEKIYHLIIHSFKMSVKEMTGEDRLPGFEVLHTTNVLHVDAAGRVVGKYNAQLDSEMAALRRVLLKASSATGPSEDR